MAVLFNIKTGLAEDVPDEAAQQSLQAGTHEVPIVSPDGDMGSASFEDAAKLMGEGYSQPGTDALHGLLKEAKYGTTGQKVIGGLEQVAKGVAGPVATAAELIAGVDPEGIRGREETKGSTEKMIEQGIGLVGSAFIPGGQAKVLSAAGKVGAEALGIGKAATTLGKIGSAAAQAAVENAVFQAGDEVSKRMLGDPDQTLGSAAANVGLAGLIGGGVGGGVGSVSPLWEATLGPKAENFLRSITNRANGESVPLSEDLNAVLSNMEKAGKEIPAEIRAGLSDNDLAHSYFQELRESGTSTGDALRETMEKFKGDVGDQLRSVFQEESPISPFEAGERAKELILGKANALNEQISSQYAEVIPHMEAIQIPDTARLKFYDKLIADGQSFGAAGSPAEGMFKNYGERALAQDSVAQLKKLNTEIGSDISVAKRAGDFEKVKALSQIKTSIKDFQDNQIIAAGKRMEAEGVPGSEGIAKALLKDRAVADKAYSKFIESIGDIASVGKLGKIRTHGQLLEALEKVPSAKLADKLFDVKNVEGLKYLKSEFPDILQTLVQAKKTSLIEAASSKGELMHNQLLNAVNRVPKEVRELMFTKEEMNTINASGKVLRESVKRMNPSGTGTTFDKMMQHLPAGVGSMASLLTGHNPITGFVLGHAGKFLARDVPDATKMSLLKFLGSAENIDASAWKSAADYLNAALKGQTAVKKATSAVLKAGQVVLPTSSLPDEKSRRKLEKKLDGFRSHPQAMLDVGGKIGHYMPDHAQAIGFATANAVNYLDGLKPREVKNSPLDKGFEDPFQKSVYENALDIAAQPLIVLKQIKDGTLLPQSVDAVKAMYPGLYSSMSQQLMDDMVSHLSEGENVPYKTRLGLSLFLGQSLDSTTLPESIIAIQNAQNRQREAKQQAETAPQGKSMKSLDKMSQNYETPLQVREEQNQNRSKRA